MQPHAICVSFIVGEDFITIILLFYGSKFIKNNIKETNVALREKHLIIIIINHTFSLEFQNIGVCYETF
jgi:hypothetical protein